MLVPHLVDPAFGAFGACICFLDHMLLQYDAPGELIIYQEEIL
jgi:hypothetical protein